MTGGRAHVVQGALEHATELAEGEIVCRVHENRGSNVFAVEDVQGHAFLCLLPAKFHKKLWLKRGSFVAVSLGAIDAPQPSGAAGPSYGETRAESVEQPGRQAEAAASAPTLANEDHSSLGASEDKAASGAHGPAASLSSDLDPDRSEPLGQQSLEEKASALQIQENVDPKGSGAAEPAKHAGGAGGGEELWEGSGGGSHKIRGVVTKVLYKHHLRVLQAAGQWSAAVWEVKGPEIEETGGETGESGEEECVEREEDEEDDDDDGLPPLTRNTNRQHMQRQHGYSSSESSDDEDSSDED